MKIEQEQKSIVSTKIEREKNHVCIFLTHQSCQACNLIYFYVQKTWLKLIILNLFAIIRWKYYVT